MTDQISTKKVPRNQLVQLKIPSNVTISSIVKNKIQVTNHVRKVCSQNICLSSLLCNVCRTYLDFVEHRLDSLWTTVMQLVGDLGWVIDWLIFINWWKVCNIAWRRESAVGWCKNHWWNTKFCLTSFSNHWNIQSKPTINIEYHFVHSLLISAFNFPFCDVKKEHYNKKSNLQI